MIAGRRVVFFALCCSILTQLYHPSSVAAQKESEYLGQFVLIQPGSFCRGDDIANQNAIYVTHAYGIQDTEVTLEQWIRVMGYSPASYTYGYPIDCGDDCPVVFVSWWDAIVFTNTLSELEGLEPCFALSGCRQEPWTVCDEVTFSGLDCSGYRLPTEAEWEWAARQCEACQHCGSQQSLAPVEMFGPDTCGLRHIFGNVWEYVLDEYMPYQPGTQLDPVAFGNSVHVVRGGSWMFSSEFCNHRYRGIGGAMIDVGFRLVRTVD